MNADDQDLTRKAIEELLREAEEQKELDEIRPNQERKINPLRRTNKQFLGRTLNAMVRHNERTDERNRARCRRKLKELNERNSRHHDKKSKKHKREDISSSDDSSKRVKKKRLKSKKHKHKKMRRRESSSSDDSSSTNDFNRRRMSREPEYEQYLPNENDGAYENAVAYEQLQNCAAWMLHPMMQLYQCKTLMELGAAQTALTEKVQIEEISVSSSSLSDVNFEEKEEEELDKSKSNAGTMLTINVSTDDDETESRKNSTKRSNTSIMENSAIEVTDSDSDASKNSNPVIEVTDSDVDEIAENTRQSSEVNGMESDNISVISLKSTDSNIAVDLTEE